MIIEYVNKSILEAPEKIIAHGVSCQGVMASGVAKVLFEKYPEVREDYLEYFKAWHSFGKREKLDFLGRVQAVNVGDGGRHPRKHLTVFNCFTQLDFGKDGKLYLDYEALRTCFRRLTKRLKVSFGETVHTIAIPKIGCGLAGGDWDFVEKIINEVTGNELNVKVYYL